MESEIIFTIDTQNKIYEETRRVTKFDECEKAYPSASRTFVKIMGISNHRYLWKSNCTRIVIELDNPEIFHIKNTLNFHVGYSAGGR